MSDAPYRFAGWFTLDVRLLATIAVFATALAVLVMAVRLKDRRWEEQLVTFMALFTMVFFAALALTNWVAGHPALRIETLFAIP